MTRGRISGFGRRRFLKHSLLAAGGAIAGSSLPGLAFPNALFAGTPPTPLQASIAVDAAQVLHPINPHIYGAIAEDIGRIIHGGVFEEGSRLSDEEGFRKDVMAAARDWGIPILRWPGGNFASGYHWEDGVGPKESRPRRYDQAWYAEHDNHFGTDEYIAYCRKINADPYICVNMGSGTMQEAANWVEYCNGTGNTSYANMRRKNGHPEPYRVRYWGLGNEVYGEWQIGHMSAEDYAKAALEWGKMMKWTDPTIKLVAVGFTGVGTTAPGIRARDWNQTVLQELTPIVDYISLHDYEGDPDYYEELGTIRKLENNLQVTAAAIKLTDYLRKQPSALMLSLPALREKKPIEIAVDEWNIWYRKRDLWQNIDRPVEEIYDLRDALWVASVLNLFHRQADKVTMACFAQMLNSIGAIFTNKTGMFLQTVYFPLKLYRNQCGDQVLRSDIQSPAFCSKSYKNVPYLDVSSTLDKARKFASVAVVNRHETTPIHATLTVQNARVGNQAEVFEINGTSPDVENSFTQPENVKINHKNVAQIGPKFEYTFPAHSVTMLKLNLT